MTVLIRRVLDQLLSKYWGRDYRDPMSASDRRFLNHLLSAYGDLLGPFEPSPHFNAGLWARIEERRLKAASWMSYWIAWAPRLSLAAVVLAAALLAAVPWLSPDDGSESALLDSSYVDVLARDSIDDPDGALWVLAENGR